MSDPRPSIVVTLPARGVEQAIAEIAEARVAGADAAEIRVDRWTPEGRARLSELFPAALPLVATYRSRREGGSAPDDPAERAPELLRLGALPFAWIDLELARDTPVVGRLPPEGELGRIVSCHLAANEAPQWAERWTELSGVSGVGKLIVPASVPVALGEILPRLLARRNDPVVVHTTGPSGPLLRALARRYGAPLVYAALPESPERPAVEPSQIPVDRLRPFLADDGEPPLFAVAGRPIAHSSSPAVHSAWMRADGRPGLYVALEFADDDEFLASLPLLAANGFRGLNVTQPFKVAAFGAATDVAPSAAACGAANCLSFQDGAVRAENTDLAAILRRMDELRDVGAWDGRRINLLGAGGAARATLAAARLLSAETTVYARRPEVARALAAEFGAQPGDPSRPEPAALTIQASGAGRRSAGPVDPALRGVLAQSSYVLDWVYAASTPEVRVTAEAGGARYEDGWRLFVYQAAASYSLWWGDEPGRSSVERTIAEGPCTG